MRWPICLALLFLAQPTASAAQDASCTYASCALRIDQGFFQTRILAGERGDAVARVGGFGTDLERRLTLPDTAIFHVQRANSRMRTGSILALIGLAGTVYGGLATGAPDTNRAVAIIAGWGFAITGGIFARHGRNELNRALWLYNAQFGH
jgi:hypothetical protein